MTKINGKKSNIDISISFDGFGKGSSFDLSSALARPYKKIIDTGRPCGKITHIFALDENNNSYVLGSLEYTPSPGKRVIFYPGLTDRGLNWYTHKGQMHDKESKTRALMDHFTLKNNFKEWHVTYKNGSGKKLRATPTFYTFQYDKLLFWFGISITNYNVLEITPNKHTITFKCPESDAERRSKIIINSRNIADLQAIKTLKPRRSQKDEFIHYDFFIAPENYNLNGKWPCYAPLFKPMLVEDYIGNNEIGVNRYNISLQNFNKKIIVCASIIEGALSNKSIMTTGNQKI